MIPFEFSVWDVFVSIFWFTLFFIWIYLWIVVISDIFRDSELGGWGKTLWILLCIVVPYFGVFIYLIVRGRSMQARARKEAEYAETARQQYIRNVAGGGGTSAADEIERLSKLKEQGVISAEEFEQGKRRVLS